ncbi:cob(I)yrinic acid a,c-diamide adenosyltransferase [Spirosoma sp. KUDC1026]|uniref:cob(I)yrinic acid a,c-diamide adenosyltransferase n=1 Tax=Spirosoma sp. KUDC1026 TaxID=2745947 RepID=UPI00159B9319|nr:cob(I)yrinic acid a,c-diamide adenosyltransferase [Spirosoma sp. KUDC1026]QKZ13294.1 cob(I)yrinic acid a,c-diamide adenosyltransferase [Spirosoma sp. KUDC1026]
MKIYTKTGDTGQTALIGGRRVSKASLQIDTYGTVDELNAWIGLVRDQSVNNDRRSGLKEIQDRLFTIGAELAVDPEKPATTATKSLPAIKPEDITALETAIDAMDATLPALRSFILPGGHQAVSFCHLARTVCRRAERLVAALNDDLMTTTVSHVDPLILQYLNRLSDYLFVLGRTMAQDLDAEEITWTSRS